MPGKLFLQKALGELEPFERRSVPRSTKDTALHFDTCGSKPLRGLTRLRGGNGGVVLSVDEKDDGPFGFCRVRHRREQPGEGYERAHLPSAGCHGVECDNRSLGDADQSHMVKTTVEAGLLHRTLYDRSKAALTLMMLSGIISRPSTPNHW